MANINEIKLLPLLEFYTISTKHPTGSCWGSSPRALPKEHQVLSFLFSAIFQQKEFSKPNLKIQILSEKTFCFGINGCCFGVGFEGKLGSLDLKDFGHFDFVDLR